MPPSPKPHRSPLSHALSHTLPHTLSHALSHALFHTLSHALSHALFHALSHALSHTPSHALSHALQVSANDYIKGDSAFFFTQPAKAGEALGEGAKDVVTRFLLKSLSQKGTAGRGTWGARRVASILRGAGD